jgi:hypothetical protein
VRLGAAVGRTRTAPTCTPVRGHRGRHAGRSAAFTLSTVIIAIDALAGPVRVARLDLGGVLGP